MFFYKKMNDETDETVETMDDVELTQNVYTSAKKSNQNEQTKTIDRQTFQCRGFRYVAST